jgi:predicted small secreted protein
MLAEVIVNVSTAMICFTGQCYPALVGKTTPLGEYQMTQYRTPIPAYGGTVLAFKETDKVVYAVHQTIFVKGQNRAERLKSNDVKQRINITNGCINVEPEVYRKLVDCCSKSKIRLIKE